MLLDTTIIDSRTYKPKETSITVADEESDVAVLISSN